MELFILYMKYFIASLFTNAPRYKCPFGIQPGHVLVVHKACTMSVSDDCHQTVHSSLSVIISSAIDCFIVIAVLPCFTVHA